MKSQKPSKFENNLEGSLRRGSLYYFLLQCSQFFYNSCLFSCYMLSCCVCTFSFASSVDDKHTFVLKNLDNTHHQAPTCDHLPEFQQTISQVSEEFCKISKLLLQALAISIGKFLRLYLSYTNETFIAFFFKSEILRIFLQTQNSDSDLLVSQYRIMFGYHIKTNKLGTIRHIGMNTYL